MTSNLTLSKILSRVPNIHVFDKDQDVQIFDPQKGKKRDKPFSEYSIRGDGSRENPFIHSSADVSPHYTVIDLWLKSREHAMGANHRPVFIEVNDCLLEVTPEGVIAGDGYFTRFYKIKFPSKTQTA